MNKLLCLLLSTMFSVNVLAADNIIKPGTADNPLGADKMYLKGADGKTVPAVVTYTTDGMGHLIPISSGGGGGGGDASAANQVIGNASLSSIDSKIPASPSQEHVTAGSPNSCRISDGTSFLSPLTDTQLRATAVPVSGTFFQATQPVSAVTLPLPSGASTSANQTTSNSTLASILSALGSPFQAGGSIGNTSFGATQATASSLNATVVGGGGAALATSANQTTGNSSLSSILAQLDVALSTRASLAKQPALGIAGTASADVITVQGVAGMTALKTDGSGFTQPVSGTFFQATQPVSGTFFQATQPVSGTVTANIGTSGSLALDASVTGLQVTQGSTTSGQKGGLVLGAVTTAAPTYTTGQSSPLSLTVAGRLRTDLGAVAGTAASTDNGTANAGTLRVAIASDNTAFSVNANAGTNLNTSALALESSLSKLTQIQGSTTSGQSGPLMQGAVSTSSPSYTTAQTSPLSLDTGGNLRTTLKSGGTPGATAPTTANLVGGTDGTNLQALSVDTTGHAQVVGSVASGSADSGNPVKVGGKFNSSTPSFTNGNRTDLQTDQAGSLYTTRRNTFTRITTATTTTVKSGAGHFDRICFNTFTNGSTFTVWDNTTATAPEIASISPPNGTGPNCLAYDVNFATGLTVVTTGTVDVTIIYY